MLQLQLCLLGLLAFGPFVQSYVLLNPSNSLSSEEPGYHHLHDDQAHYQGQLIKKLLGRMFLLSLQPEQEEQPQPQAQLAPLLGGKPKREDEKSKLSPSISHIDQEETFSSFSSSRVSES